jgi:hypothetical protein
VRIGKEKGGKVSGTAARTEVPARGSSSAECRSHRTTKARLGCEVVDASMDRSVGVVRPLPSTCHDARRARERDAVGSHAHAEMVRWKRKASRGQRAKGRASPVMDGAPGGGRSASSKCSTRFPLFLCSHFHRFLSAVG